MYYMSMVMMFQFSSQEGLIYIDSLVENCLQIHLIEDHLTETHLEDHHMIHMLEFMDGRH
jgi:hypothetical protein